jgi:predicted tellurium resistance membrane protein TerC
MSGIETIVSLLTLSGLQVVLSVDNIVVIAIVAGTLPPRQRDRARVIGLALATITRLALLFSITWITGLTEPLVTVLDLSFSGRDLMMLSGGLFLIVKAVREMHEALESAGSDGKERRHRGNFVTAIVMIVAVDIVFSLDSIMAAVGMSNDLWIMAASVVIGSIVLLVASGPIMQFILIHPTVKMLALAFVLLIGMALVADGMGFDMPRGYLYFAIVFSVFVEGLNMVLRRRHGLHLSAPSKTAAEHHPTEFNRPLREAARR